jgi:hypothetical protein
MKRILFMIAFVIAAMAAIGQRQAVITLQTDTLKGTTGSPKSSPIITLTGAYESLAIQALCTQLGGTSDGNIAVYGSLDGTSWTLINGVGGHLIASPKASNTGTDFNQLTITNGLVGSWVIQKPAHRYYKTVSNGTASDTTKVVIKYTYK